MPIITTGPSAAGLGSTCDPWASIADVGSPCDDYAFDVALLEDALQIASDVLFNLTGRQWAGECQQTIRPCGYRQPGSCGCLSSRTCSCRRLSELDLPGTVISVDEVKIDGAVVAPARYRVDDYVHLVYLPESDSAERQGWPCCQRLDLADTEDDTWSITYSFGQYPPAGGVRAAAALGCQLALAFQPETIEECRLPARVTSLSRQGMSMAIIDPLTLFADGLTGLTEVDLWVQSIMLGAKRRRAQVWVPGQPVHGTRQVGT
jgi:hypothetical protein